MLTFFTIAPACIASFYLGYQFCMLRWRPRLLTRTIKMHTDLISGKIDAQQALKEMEEIEAEL